MKNNRLVSKTHSIVSNIDLTNPGLWCVSLSPKGGISRLKSLNMHQFDDFFQQSHFLLETLLAEKEKNLLIIRVSNSTHYFDEQDWSLVNLLLKSKKISILMNDYIKTTGERSSCLSDFVAF